MKILKVGVWFLGAVALFLLARSQGVQNGSAYIQFVDGIIIAYTAGELIEKLPLIKKFIENHHALLKRVEELHAKHEELHTRHTRLIDALERVTRKGDAHESHTTNRRA